MEVISWDQLTDYLERDLPAVIPIPGKRNLCIAISQGPVKLSLRIPCDSDQIGITSPYQEISYQGVAVSGRPVLELGTSSQGLFHGFYLFITLIVERIEERGEDIFTAVHHAQQVVGQLLVQRNLLTEQKQIGLMGELCMLQSILRSWGPPGFDAWLGPRAERHDFRMGAIEIEVKSTLANTRKHLINGLAQLEASPGKSLFILSIQFEFAGAAAGHSLPDRIDDTRSLLKQDVPRMELFNAYVRRLGYQDCDAALYPQRYQMRSKAALVPVTGDCPKLTEREIAALLPPALFSRIAAVEYEIDLSGLGYLEGSEPFVQVLPNVSLA